MGIREKLGDLTGIGAVPVFRGLIATYLLILLFSFILGGILYLTPWGEAWLDPIGVMIIAVALFCGGYTAAHRAGNRGLFHGLIVGLFFILFLLIFSLSKEMNWSAFLFKSGCSLLAAALGGISGVK